MSGNPTTITKVKKQPAKSSARSEPTKKEIHSLDLKLQRLSSDNIIQTSPYILTVPSDRPYHVNRHQANDWMRRTPFDRNEEQLQYLSFLPEWDHGLITPVGAWENDKGGMDALSHSGRSAAGTPTVAPKKQKLSLSEYKNKKGQGSAPSATKGEPSRSAVNGGTSGPSKASSSSKGTLSHKRSRDEALGPDSLKGDPRGRDVSHSKKLKPSPSPSPAPPKKKGGSSSPVLELPPDISPTLPPVIEKELKRLEELANLDSAKDKEKPKAKKEPPARSNDYSKDKVPSSSSKSNGLVKPSPTQKSERPINSSSIGLGILDKPPTKLIIKKEKKIEPVARRLLVKLKIPKSLRPRCQRLLKIQPTRQGPESSKMSRADGRDVGTKTVEREPGKVSGKSTQAGPGEKRPRLDAEGESSAPPQKRPRAPSSLDLPSKPSTPVPPAFKSPVLSHHGSAQKGKASTPAANYHEEVATPQGAVRNGTPSAPDSVDRSSKTSGPSKDRSGKNQDALTALHRAQQQHHITGRKLKHSSDRESKDPHGAKKKALALGIESLLCFMLSYAIRDEIFRLTRPEKRDDTWTTIFPYINIMKQHAQAHPHLRGLCAQLEAVCHTAAFNSECERGHQYPSQPPSQSTILKHLQSASDLFFEGSSELSVDDLQHEFPNSWRQKARKPLARQKSKFDMKIEGEFYLPLTNITTGIEAVRAGKSLLTEWCKMEGVQWEPIIGKSTKDDTK